MSLHGRTFCSARKSAETKVRYASVTIAARIPPSISAIVSGERGPVQLKVPYVSFSQQRMMNSDRSRASMICDGSLGVPGAITSPPRCSRAGQ